MILDMNLQKAIDHSIVPKRCLIANPQARGLLPASAPRLMFYSASQYSLMANPQAEPRPLAADDIGQVPSELEYFPLSHA